MGNCSDVYIVWFSKDEKMIVVEHSRAVAVLRWVHNSWIVWLWNSPLRRAWWKFKWNHFETLHVDIVFTEFSRFNKDDHRCQSSILAQEIGRICHEGQASLNAMTPKIACGWVSFFVMPTIFRIIKKDSLGRKNSWNKNWVLLLKLTEQLIMDGWKTGSLLECPFSGAMLVFGESKIDLRHFNPRISYAVTGWIPMGKFVNKHRLPDFCQWIQVLRICFVSRFSGLLKLVIYSIWFTTCIDETVGGRNPSPVDM